MMADQDVLKGIRSAESILAALQENHYFCPRSEVLKAALDALVALNAELKSAAAGAAFIGTNEQSQVVMQFPTLMQFVILTPEQARSWARSLLHQAGLAEHAATGDTLHAGDDPHVDQLTSIHAALDTIEDEAESIDRDDLDEAVENARTNLKLFEAHYIELRGFVTQSGVALRNETSPAAPEGSDNG